MSQNSAHSTDAESGILHRIYESTVDYIYDFLFSLREAASTPSVIFIALQWLVVTLQLCHFISDRYVRYHWNSRVSEVFNTITTFVSFFPGLEREITSFHVACSVVYGTAAVALAAALFNRTFKWTWPLVVAFHALQFATTTFFIPAVSTLANVLFGCVQAASDEPHPFYPRDFTCWTGTMVGVSVVSIIFIIILLLIALGAQATLHPIALPKDLNGRDPLLARHTNRAECAGLLVKVALLILFAAARSDSWRLPMAILMFLGGALVTVLHVLLLEPFSDTAATLHVAQWLLLTWSGAIAIFMSFLFDAEGVGMLFFLCLPLVFVAAAFLVRYRYRTSVSRGDKELVTGLSYVLFCRALIRNHIRKHERFDSWVDDSPYIADATTRLHDLVELTLGQGLLRFPDSAPLRCFRAYFFYFVRPKPVVALQEMNELAELNTAFDIRFLQYAIRRQDSLAVRHHLSADIEKYIEFNETKETADRVLFAASRSLALFWNELLQRFPCVDKIADLGHEARTHLAEAQEHYKRLLSINHQSIALLQTLGMLYLHLTGETLKAAEITARIEAVEAERKREAQLRSERALTDRSKTGLDIFDDYNAVVAISLADHEFCIVKNASGSTLATFGFTHPRQLIGRSINTIMPPEIAGAHDQVLRDFMGGTDSRVVNHVRTVFASQQVTGYLIPIYLFVRWGGEGTLVGVMQPIPIKPGQAYVSVDPETFAIRSATQEFHSLFGVSRRDVQARTATASMVLPGLIVDGEHNEPVLQKMATKAGAELDGMHALTGRALSIHVWSIAVKSKNYNLLFFRMDVTQINEAEDVLDQVDEPTARLTAAPVVELSDDDNSLDEAMDSSHRLLDAKPASATFAASMQAALAAPTPTASADNATTDDAAHPAPATGLLDMLRAAEPASLAPTPTSALAPKPQPAADSMSQLGSAEGFADMTLQQREAMRQKQAMYMHRKLRRAIRRDDLHTERTLYTANVMAVMLVLAMMAVAIALFVTWESNMADAKLVYDVVYLSSVRSFYITSVIPQLVQYMHVVSTPAAAPLQYYQYVHPSSDHAAIVSFERTYYMQILNHLAQISADVDRTHIRAFNSSIEDIRNKNTLKMEQLYGGKPGFIMMSLKEALTSTSAAGQRVAYLLETQGFTAADEDMSFWWMMANGNQRLREASRQLTSLLLDAFADHRSRLVILPLWFLIGSVTTMLIVMWTKMKPILMKIEDGKTQVLDIFLDIPRGIRRALRRKAYIVYNALKTAAEDEHLEGEQEGEDEDEVAQANKDQAALDSLVGSDDAIVRYARMRSAEGSKSARSTGAKDSLHSPRTAGSAPGEAVDALSARAPDPRVMVLPHGPAVMAGTVNLRVLSSRLRSDQASEPSVKAEVETEAMSTTTTATFLSRRSLRMFMLKYFVFVLFVVAYFLSLIMIADNYLTYQDKIANLFVSAARRMPMLKTSWHITRLHLYTNYTQLALDDPNSPYIRAGNYIKYGQTLLKNAENYNREAVFGTAEIPSLDAPELKHILFEDACDIPRSRFEHLDIEIDDYFFANCRTIGSGIFKKGFYALWMELVDSIGPLLSPKFSNYLSYYLNPASLPSTITLAQVTSTLTLLRNLGEYIVHFVSPLVRVMNAVVHEHGRDTMNQFGNIRVGMFIAYLAILAMLYLLVLAPTSKFVSKDASRTKSTMQLLHPDLTTRVPRVQQYIQDNISLE